MQHRFRGIAQLVEQRSPKPRAVSSRLTTPATNLRSSRSGGFVFAQTYSPSHRCAMPAPSGMGPLCPCKEAPSWKELAANAVSRLRKSAFFIFFAAFLLIFEKIRLTKADFFYIIEKMFNYTSLNVCFHIAT